MELGPLVRFGRGADPKTSARSDLPDYRVGLNARPRPRCRGAAAISYLLSVQLGGIEKLVARLGIVTVGAVLAE